MPLVGTNQVLCGESPVGDGKHPPHRSSIIVQYSIQYTIRQKNAKQKLRKSGFFFESRTQAEDRQALADLARHRMNELSRTETVQLPLNEA